MRYLIWSSRIPDKRLLSSLSGFLIPNHHVFDGCFQLGDCTFIFFFVGVYFFFIGMKFLLA